jgi:FKBP-type peptidyl-prolyl cis-trans isomerase FkpA
MKLRWLMCGALVFATSMTAGCRRRRGGVVGTSNANAAPRTDDERTLYVLGQILGERVGEFNLTPREAAVVARGLTDQIAGTHAVNMEQYGPRIRDLQRSRSMARSASTRQEGTRYLEQAANEPGAQRLPSGVIYRELQPGTGPQPTASDEVTVQYRGTLINGTEFDSSYSHGQPATFQLNGVIPCWTEGVQRMHVGGRARLVCPPDTAYGDRGQRQIPPGSTLIFEVELVSIRGNNAADAGAAPAAP